MRLCADPFLDLAYAKYQLQYDSVHGKFPGVIDSKDGTRSISLRGNA
jgi:glyceraldehyde-3-phosphate dehydrogenase/erythrose-4-phosphate dehydrogenase